ncbi:MAG: hypothetical protein EPO09_01860 [Aquabacterium sp.]|uniref:hypothetical protein n=1 Tax=Aquabacterium sp. TaxID=1872578 RepID=UPI00120413E7|nr:hypothetical protein [Aquabacterium sp.]TAK98893.1 MAG: hypothetical protein EPO09_01860 [Aquabacterium sp.]
MNQPSTPLLAWHYTLGVHLLRILENGYILPQDTPETPAVECPVAWFSLSQQHDPSALKSILVNGVAQPPTLAVMKQLGNGVYRLGISPRALLGGEALRREARISKARWAELTKQAKACGANVAQWFGAIDPVAASDCVIEVLGDDGKWKRVAS